MAFTLLTSEENQLLSLGIRYILLPEAAPPALSLTTIPSLRLNLPAEPKQAQRVLQQRASQQNAFQQRAFQQNASQQRAFQQNVFQQNAFQQSAFQQRASQQNTFQQRSLQEAQTRTPYYKFGQGSQKSYNKPTEHLYLKKEESSYRLRPFNDWPGIWKNYFQKLYVPQDKNKLVVWTYLELDEDMRHQNASWMQHKDTILSIIHHPWLPPLLKPDLYLPMKLKGLNFELDIFLATLYRIKVSTLVCFGYKTITLLKLSKTNTPFPYSKIKDFSFWAVPMKSLEELANSNILRLQMELLQSFSKQKNKKFLK